MIGTGSLCRLQKYRICQSYWQPKQTSFFVIFLKYSVCNPFHLHQITPPSDHTICLNRSTCKVQKVSLHPCFVFFLFFFFIFINNSLYVGNSICMVFWHWHLAPSVERLKNTAGGGVEVRCGNAAIAMTTESSQESNSFIVWQGWDDCLQKRWQWQNEIGWSKQWEHPADWLSWQWKKYL